MASLMSQYTEILNKYNEQLSANCLPPDSWAKMQETTYRLEVLSTFKMYRQTAPITTDKQLMSYHFQLLDIFIGFVSTERRFAPTSNDDANKTRQTAGDMFAKVIQDGRRQFKSFVAKSDQHYKNSVLKYIDTILCAWIQYRNTYINIDIGGLCNESK